MARKAINDPEQESMSSEVPVDDPGKGGGMPGEAEGADNDAVMQVGSAEVMPEGLVVEEDDEEDDLELTEDEYEGEDEDALEDVAGFDESMIEAAALNGENFIDEEMAALPECGPQDFGAPESVCGRDNRVRITATTRVPWRWNCQLIITSRSGSRGRCTGWFIGPRTIMTAGHCLYSHSAGGWARQIEVIPGMNGGARPFGSMVSRTFRSVRGWVSSRRPEYDYGAIILPSCRWRNLGYFGFGSYSSSTLRGLMVNNAGYAGDKPFGTQWFNADRITRVTSRRLYYMLDTYGGHSGSAVWRMRRVGSRYYRYAVGIHGYGGCPNKAVRINRPVFDNMQRWKAEGRC